MITKIKSYLKTNPCGATSDTIAMQIGESRDMVIMGLEQLVKSGRVRKDTLAGTSCCGSCGDIYCKDTDREIFIWKGKYLAEKK